jgi:hypothetical protein
LENREKKTEIKRENAYLLSRKERVLPKKKMLTLSGLFLALFVATLFAYLVSTVVLVSLEQADDALNKDWMGLGKVFLLQVVNGTVFVAVTFALSLVKIALHLRTYWYIYVGLGLIAIPAELNAAFSDEIWEGTDAAFTRFWVPFFRNVILRLLDIAERLWNILICPYNLLHQLGRVFGSNFFDIAVACEGMRWGDVADIIADIMSSTLTSVGLFIFSFFGDDLDLTTPTSHVARLIGVFEPVYNCECQMLGFAYEWVIRVVQSKNLHNAWDRWVNFQISVVREFLQFLVALFDAIFGTGAIIGANEGDELPVIRGIEFGTNPDRAPRWANTSSNACLTVLHAWEWIDDIIGISLDIFAGVDPAKVPKIGQLWGNAICVGIDVVRIFADVQFHLDVFFAGNFWGAIQDDLDPLFAHAYNASAGIVSFFEPLDHPITDDLGCVLSATANTTIAAAEIVARITLAIPDNFLDFDGIKDFIETDRIQDPADFMEEQALLAVDCMGSLMTHINEPLGEAFNETVHAITSAARIVVGLVLNVRNLFEHLGGTEYDEETKRLFKELFAVSIAYANFMRQFTITDPDAGPPFGKCWLRDVHLNQTDFHSSLNNADVFCCTGKLVEGVMRTVFWFLEFIVRGIHVIFEADSFRDAWRKLFSEPDGPGKVSKLVAPLEQVIEAGVCYTPAMIELIGEVLQELGKDQPTIDHWMNCDLAGRMATFMGDLLKLVLTPFRLIDIGLEMIGLFLGVKDDDPPPHQMCPVDFVHPIPSGNPPGNQGDDLGNFGLESFNTFDCTCWAYLRFYAQTIGRIVQVIASGAKFAECLFGSVAPNLSGFFIDASDLLERFFAAPFDPTDGQLYVGQSSPPIGGKGYKWIHPESIFWRLCLFIDALTDILELIGLMFTDFPEFLTQLLLKWPFFNKLVTWITAVVNWAPNFFSALLSAFGCIFTFIGDVVTKFFSNLLDCLRELISLCTVSRPPYPAPPPFCPHCQDIINSGGVSNPGCFANLPSFPSFPSAAFAGKGYNPDEISRMRYGFDIAKKGGEGQLVNKSVTFFWELDDPAVPCAMQAREYREETNPRLKRLLLKDAEWCYVSGLVSRVIDVGLSHYSEDLDRRIVDPYILYDWGIGFDFVRNVTTRVPHMSRYLFEHIFTDEPLEPSDFNHTMVEYLAIHNASWEVTDMLAYKVEMLARAFEAARENGIRTRGGDLIEIVLDISKFWSGWKFPNITWGSGASAEPPLIDPLNAENLLARREEAAEIGNALLYPGTWARAASKGKQKIVNATAPFFGGGLAVANEIFRAWLVKSGYRRKPHLFDGLYVAAAAARARFQWRMAGGAMEDEPEPHGTKIQLDKWARFTKREADARTEEEKEHWRTVRAREVPNLAYFARVDAEKHARGELVTSDCGDRSCWDHAGNVIGDCKKKAPGIFCECELPNQINGACCLPDPQPCFQFGNEANCLLDAGTFLLGHDCESCFVQVNETVGACCLQDVVFSTSTGTGPPPKRCRILAFDECDALGGTWNANKTCAADDLAPECKHCALRRVPDIDIGGELLCPLAGDVTFAPCPKRNCWDPIGDSIGNCTLGSEPIFGNPQCECEFPSLTNATTGACCKEFECDITSSAACAANASWTFMPESSCGACFVTLNASNAACCHGPPEGKSCDMTDAQECFDLGGIWNQGRDCSSNALDADCEACSAKGCRSCNLLIAVINQVIDLIVGCINDMIALREGAATTLPTKEQKDAARAARSFRMSYDPPSSFRPPRRKSIVGDGVQSLTRFFFRVIEWVLNGILALIEWAFGAWLGFAIEFRLDLVSLVDRIADFVTNDDVDDPNGLLFWVFFMFRCNFVEGARCEEGRTGTGLPNGILWVYGVLIVLAILVIKFFPFLTFTIALLFGISIVIVLSVSYHISPWCFTPPFIIPLILPSPWPLPLIPNCAFPDAADQVRRLDVPCLPLCSVAGNQSMPSDPDCDQEAACPGSGQNFRRKFPDCWNAPYLFRGPLRNLFFFLRFRAPGISCFLVESENSIGDAATGEFPLLEERSTFPGDQCGEPDFVDDRWKWCFRSNWLMWFVLLAIVMFVGVVLAETILVLYLLFVAWIAALSALLLFLLAIFSRTAKTGDKPMAYYRKRRPTVPYPPDPRTKAPKEQLTTAVQRLLKRTEAARGRFAEGFAQRRGLSKRIERRKDE